MSNSVPYDLRLNDKGTYDLWLLQGNAYIRLPHIKETIIKQVPDLKDGYAEVNITVLVNVINEHKPKELKRVYIRRMPDEYDKPRHEDSDTWHVVNHENGFPLYQGTIKQCNDFINKDPYLIKML